MSHLFLSYSHADSEHARKLFGDLKRRGFQLWFDEESLQPGQIWEDEIENAIHSASLVLVLLSTHSVDRAGYAQKEIRTALATMERMPEGKPYLVPLKLDECQIPKQLSHIHCGALREESDFERLAKALHEFVGVPNQATGLAANYSRHALRFESTSELILPGYGIAGVKVGANPAAVRRRLGEPDKVTDFENCRYMSYPKMGLDFLIEKDVVRAAFAYAEGADKNSAFVGETPEGISTGSTRGEIESVFGRPTVVGGEGAINYWMSYEHAGLGVTFDTLDTKDFNAIVHHLHITAAKE